MGDTSPVLRTGDGRESPFFLPKPHPRAPRACGDTEMRRLLLFAALSCASLMAACSGGSAADEPAPTSPAVRTPTTASSATATPAETSTEVADTPTATLTATTEPEPATPEAPTPEAPTPAPTTGGGTNPPTAVVVPPTPTSKPASGNPMSATVGASTARFVWSPSRVSVAIGGTVTWAWSNAPQLHNVVGDNFALGPTEFKASDKVSFTFTSAGTYTFTCQSHPGMDGTVVVQ